MSRRGDVRQGDTTPARRRLTPSPEAFVAALGPDLTEGEQMRLVGLSGVRHAPLPANWVKAKRALAAALHADEASLPGKWEAAMAAAAECLSADECATWPKAAALASYARQSGDKSLERLARRLRERMRAGSGVVP